jgi:hypothetical protein
VRLTAVVERRIEAATSAEVIQEILIGSPPSTAGWWGLGWLSWPLTLHKRAVG